MLHLKCFICKNSTIKQSEESIWLKFEYILELAQWLYSNEYDLESCIDLVEWAADLVMFSVHSARGSGSVGVGGVVESIKNSSRSRVSTGVSLTRKSLSQQASKQQRLGNKLGQTSSNALLPTIMDETQATTVSLEVATMSSQAEKNAEDEIDMLIRKSKRDNLFGKS